MVAIKVMNPALAATSPPRKRFLREARSSAAVRHENIVAIHAVEEQPVPYLVMEYIPGKTLQQWQDEHGPLDPVDVLKFGQQIAAGLAAAHAQGLIHRDIKPANILLDTSIEARIKITDFGLARAVDDASMTQSGLIAGTPMYMAPEQARGQTLDHRADLFSLGTVLYTMASGRPPFRASNTIAVLKRVCEDTPRPVSEVIPGSPRWLDEIITKLHAKEPDDRFQTAKEVADLLARCQSEFQHAGQVTCVPLASAGSVSARSTPTDSTIVRPANRLPKSSETSEVSPPRTGKPSAKALLGLLAIAALIPILWYALPPSPKPLAIDRSGCRMTSAEPGGDGRSLTTSATTGWHGWPADAPQPAIAPFNAEQAKQHQKAWAEFLKVPVEYTNSLGMKFRLIPPGEFTMGSTAEEIAAALKDVGENKHWQECIQSEAPQHKVILTQPIYLGVNEVTQAEYEKVMGSNPSHFAPMGAGKEAVTGLETADHPVEMVSWNDAAEFCAKLSQQEKLKPFYFRAGETITPLDGTGYRLPSEAEWECACRAGTATKYWIGDQDEDLVRAGWFNVNSGGRTNVVRKLKDNPFGLYDVHGNVWELLQDGWDATYYDQFSEKPAINPNSPFSAGSRRVFRGGERNHTASVCRSSGRAADDPTYRDPGVGFRVSLTVEAVRQALKVTGPAMPKGVATNTHSGSRETSDDARRMAAPGRPSDALPNTKKTAEGGHPTQTTPSAPALDPIDFAAERQAAERVLKLKRGTGWLLKDVKGNYWDLKEPLPQEPFFINHAALQDIDLTDEELAGLAGCRGFETLNLKGNPKLTAAGLKSLGPLPGLKFLDLSHTACARDSLEFIAIYPKLERLSILVSGDSRAGIMQTLPPCPRLISLVTTHLSGSVGDEGLKTIVRQCPCLAELTLMDDEVRSLAPLAQLQKLQYFQCQGTHLTEAGINALNDSPALEKLMVDYPDRQIVQRLIKLDRKLRELTLRETGNGRAMGITDPADWMPVTRFTNLEKLTADGFIAIDAAALQAVATMPRLKSFVVYSGSIPEDQRDTFRNFTADDIAAFRKARPDVQLNIDGQEYPATK